MVLYRPENPILMQMLSGNHFNHNDTISYDSPLNCAVLRHILVNWLPLLLLHWRKVWNYHNYPSLCRVECGTSRQRRGCQLCPYLHRPPDQSSSPLLSWDITIILANVCHYRLVCWAVYCMLRIIQIEDLSEMLPSQHSWFTMAEVNLPVRCIFLRTNHNNQ